MIDVAEYIFKLKKIINGKVFLSDQCQKAPTPNRHYHYHH